MLINRIKNEFSRLRSPRNAKKNRCTHRLISGEPLEARQMLTVAIVTFEGDVALLESEEEGSVTAKQSLELSSQFSYGNRPDVRGIVSVALTDLTGDGSDEAILFRGDGLVQIFNEAGNMPFAPFDCVTSGIGTSYFVGDVNLDGTDEIVCNSWTGAHNHVNAFNANGSLQSSTFITLQYHLPIFDATISDIDGDDRAEILLIELTRVVPYDLDGIPQSSYRTPPANSAHDTLTLADLNNDGRVDPVFASASTGRVFGYTTDFGITTWRPQFPYGPGDKLVSGDFNGNGFASFIVVDQSDSAFRFNVSGENLGRTSIPVDSNLATGDMDGDGKDELYAIAANGDVLVYSLVDQTANQSLVFGDGFTVGDVTGNGIDEYLFASRDTNLLTIIDRDNIELASFNVGFEAGDLLTAGDLDGDGTDEIIIADSSSRQINIVDKDGNRPFPRIPSSVLTNNNPLLAIGVGDLDGFVSSNRENFAGLTQEIVVFQQNRVTILDRNGNLIRTEFMFFSAGDEVAIGDVAAYDGTSYDGRDEIIVGHSTGRVDILQLDDNNDVVTQGSFNPGFTNLALLAAGDFNASGRDEILIAHDCIVPAAEPHGAISACTEQIEIYDGTGTQIVSPLPLDGMRFGGAMAVPKPDDRDLDFLYDTWETNGIDVDADGTIDLRLPGADPDHKDLYVEVDAMVGRAPTQAVLDRVARSFAEVPNRFVNNPDGKDGINLHIEFDEPIIPLAAWSASPFDNEFPAMKSQWFGTLAQRISSNSQNILDAKRLVYRYGPFVDRYGTTGSSGLGELNGNDFFVSLGTWGEPESPGGTFDQQAGTFMHELGHTLGLGHGGADGENYKPNYHSVMNYIWQTPNDAYSGSWQLNFSREVVPPLDEVNLNEQTGIGFPDDHSFATRNFFRATIFNLPFFSFFLPPDFAFDINTHQTKLKSSGELVDEFGPVDFNDNGTIDTAPVIVDINDESVWLTNIIPGTNTISQLDSGVLPVGVRNLINGAGVTLDANVTIANIIAGQQWDIISGNEVYEIRIDSNNNLDVFDQRSVLIGHNDWENIRYGIQGRSGHDDGGNAQELAEELTFDESEALQPFPTIIVNHTGDFDDNDAGNDTMTLREAIRIANAQIGHDTIGFSLPHESTIELQLGQFNVTDSLAIDASMVSGLTIDGRNRSRLFHISDGDEANALIVSLTNLNLAGGRATDDGGAILAEENVLVFDTVLEDNSALNEGGAIAVIGGFLSLQNSQLRENSATSDGGALYARGNAVVEILTSTIESNVASERGGAIFSENSVLLIHQSTISNNTGTEGGAIRDRSGWVSIANSTISGNHGIRSGGGIFSSESNLEVLSSTIANNRTDEDGGGIWNDRAQIALSGSIVADNTALGNGNDVFGEVESFFGLIEDVGGASILGGPNVLGEDPQLAELSLNGGSSATHLPAVTSPVIDAMPSSSYQNDVLSTIPLAYYRFDSEDGRDSARGNDATPVGGVAFEIVGATRISGQSIRFNGTDSYLDTNLQLNGTSAFSIEAWLNPAAAQANRTGIAGQNDVIEFGFIDADTIELWTPGQGGLQFDYDSEANAGEWIHLVAVGTGDEKQIFLNGDLVATQAHAPVGLGGYGSSAFEINIGGGGIFHDSGNFFNGQMDEVSLSSRAMQADQIERRYALGRIAQLQNDQHGTERPQGLGFDLGAVELKSGISDSDHTTFTVDTTEDIVDGDFSAGDLSLREAIELANASELPDTIRFNLPSNSRIVLAESQLRITDSMSILGPGAADLTIDANGQSRVFQIINDTDEPSEINVALQGLTITGGRFDTFEESGGGVEARSFGPRVEVQVRDSRITGNRSGTGGAGIYAGTGTSMIVVGSTITDNRTESLNFGTGGGIWSEGDLLVVERSTISNNFAKFGGGIFATHLQMDNSTISQNVAELNVAGVLANSGQITSSTIVRNRVEGIVPFTEDGIGGLDGNGVVELHYSIVAGNTFREREDSAAAASDLGNSAVSSSYNVIGDAASAGSIVHETNGNFVGNNGVGVLPIASIIDPVLANNGGTTPTHQLANGSPALDALAAGRYQQDVLNGNPLAYYQFVANVGTNSILQNDADLFGRIDTVFESAHEDLGNAIRLDGASSVATGISLNGVGQFSLEAWINTSQAQANRTGIIGQNDLIEFGFIDAMTIQLWTPTQGALNVAFDSVTNLGEWVHVAAIGTGTSKQIFIDGQLAGEQMHPALGAAGYGTSDFTVNVGGGGIFDATGNHFNGLVDEVAIYDQALSAEEISRRIQLAAVPISSDDQIGSLRPLGDAIDIGAFENLPAAFPADGDFNSDGVTDEIDINQLCRQHGLGDLFFDLNQDGVVDFADSRFLIKNILGTSFGDATLDGTFNSTDLIRIFSAGEYQDAIVGNSGWSEGDWNCDGDFDTGDLILAFSEGAYVNNAVAFVDSPVVRCLSAGRFESNYSEPAHINRHQAHADVRPRAELARHRQLDFANVDNIFAKYHRLRMERHADNLAQNGDPTEA